MRGLEKLPLQRRRELLRTLPTRGPIKATVCLHERCLERDEKEEKEMVRSIKRYAKESEEVAVQAAVGADEVAVVAAGVAAGEASPGLEVLNDRPEYRLRYRLKKKGFPKYNLEVKDEADFWYKEEKTEDPEKKGDPRSIIHKGEGRDLAKNLMRDKRNYEKSVRRAKLTRREDEKNLRDFDMRIKEAKKERFEKRLKERRAKYEARNARGLPLVQQESFGRTGHNHLRNQKNVCTAYYHLAFPKLFSFVHSRRNFRDG